MQGHFSLSIRKHSERIVHEWVEAVYRERRTQLASRLSFEQLVNNVPEILEELAHLLDGEFSDAEIAESAIRLRTHPHVRFRQGVLIDEAVRELLVLGDVIAGFLWCEALAALDIRSPGVREGLRQCRRLIGEIVVQTVVVYAASFRPPVETRTSMWPPPRRRKSDFVQEEN